MSNRFFIGTILTGMMVLSGCLAAQNFTSNVEVGSIAYSRNAAENISDIYVAYSDCLSNGFVNLSKQRLENNDLPDMRAKTYENLCLREETLLYQAFYSGSRDHDPSGPEQFAHNTATKGVAHVKTITFEAIAEGFQPPK